MISFIETMFPTLTITGSSPPVQMHHATLSPHNKRCVRACLRELAQMGVSGDVLGDVMEH